MTPKELNDADITSLRRIEYVLASVAPEIARSELAPDARLLDDLGLDQLSVWALAHGLEKLAKVDIPDQSILNASTISDVISMAISDAPVPKAFSLDGSNLDESVPLESQSRGPSDESNSANRHELSDQSLSPQEGAPQDIEGALADLASFFNN